MKLHLATEKLSRHVWKQKEGQNLKYFKMSKTLKLIINLV